MTTKLTTPRNDCHRHVLAALTPIVLGSALALASVDKAEALSIPVNCNNMLVGTVTVNIVPGGVSGGFTTNAPTFATLADAAKKCNEDHFNWLQIVIKDNKPPVDAGGNRLAPPYVDPPPGGYGNDPNTIPDDTQWADNLPWYWDEGADPPAGTPGFSDGFNLLDNIVGNTLKFSDFPGGIAGTNLSFKTFLASVNADGSLHALHGDFVWDWSNASGSNVASNLRLPEPSALAVFVFGLAALGAWRRRRGTQAH